MIFRDEAPTIARAIASIRPWLSAFELSDTGSTDNSLELATQALTGLRGNISQDLWRDFSSNRNVVLERSRKYNLPILFLDSDDEIVATGAADHATWDVLTAWAYDGSIRHKRVLAVAPKFDAVWQGRIHEQLTWPDHLTPTLHHASGFFVRYRHDGARSRSGRATTLNDAAILRSALRMHPNCYRLQYYLARTFHQAGMSMEAICEYERYLRFDRPDDETTFHSYWSLAVLYEATGRGRSDVLHCLLNARRARPIRIEPLLMSARIHRESGDPNSALERCTEALQLSATTEAGAHRLHVPDDDLVDVSYYGWRLYDELATNSILMDRVQLAQDALRLALTSPYLPDDARARLFENSATLR